MKVKGGSWIWDSRLNKLVPKADYYHPVSATPAVINDIEAFQSPIDGRTITGRAALREHNREHGVTDLRDYGETWFPQQAKRRDDEMCSSTAGAKRDRIETIRRAIDRHSH